MANIQRLMAALSRINQFGADPKGEGITRLAYSKTYMEALEDFKEICEAEQMAVRVDAFGNLIARREGKDPKLPAVALGSHMDTVNHGGEYDGTLGVAAALEVIRSLNEERIETVHPIELIVFACEESARFGSSTLGSKAMTGLLDTYAVSNLRDKNGITIQQAFRECSLDFQNIGEAIRRREELKVFLELHIEQGPLLESLRKQIGIVTGIASPTRIQVHVSGKASHSGTTPMNDRQDALAAAAEIILKVESEAKKESEFGTVGTVGVCMVQPGAMNVIPDSVTLQLEVRGTSEQSKNNVLDSLFRLFRELEDQRGVIINPAVISVERPVLLSKEVVAKLTECSEAMDLSYIRMTSGAGHDAMSMAHICPTGLIFIPCREGLSHHPDEFAAVEDIEAGLRLLKEAVLTYAIPS
ncbi:Zn-dependent hydrolase [Paenibacillus fonticola]|uniref:Zn-dependent hydrolase n=1 Tax=Paenibacillus fonticola TaxID=379896 RepID=UPI0003615225|nr:Zn-dependent hydrolase [Paenibacillus fonticola]